MSRKTKDFTIANNSLPEFGNPPDKHSRKKKSKIRKKDRPLWSAPRTDAPLTATDGETNSVNEALGYSQFHSHDAEHESDDGWSDTSGRSSEPDLGKERQGLTKNTATIQTNVAESRQADPPMICNLPVPVSFSSDDEDSSGEDSDHGFAHSALGASPYTVKQRSNEDLTRDINQRPPSPPASPKKNTSEHFIGYRSMDTNRKAIPHYLTRTSSRPDPSDSPNFHSSNARQHQHEPQYNPNEQSSVGSPRINGIEFAGNYGDGRVSGNEKGTRGYDPDYESDQTGLQYIPRDPYQDSDYDLQNDPRYYPETAESGSEYIPAIYNAEFPDASKTDPETGYLPSQSQLLREANDSISSSQVQKRDRRTMTWLIVCLGCALVALAALTGGIVGALVSKEDADVVELSEPTENSSPTTPAANITKAPTIPTLVPTSSPADIEERTEGPTPSPQTFSPTSLATTITSLLPTPSPTRMEQSTEFPTQAPQTISPTSLAPTIPNPVPTPSPTDTKESEGEPTQSPQTIFPPTTASSEEGTSNTPAAAITNTPQVATTPAPVTGGGGFGTSGGFGTGGWWR